MIPKTLYLVWLSGNKFTERVKNNLETWKKFCPDYDIRHITSNDVSDIIEKSEFLKLIYPTKKYPFITDYIRFWLLYEFGGIYLDSDVEIKMPLDNLLDNDYFIGHEKTVRKQISYRLEAAVIGSIPKLDCWKCVMDFYDENAKSIYKHIRLNHRMGEIKKLGIKNGIVCPEVLEAALKANNYEFVHVMDDFKVEYKPNIFYIMGDNDKNIMFSRKGKYTEHQFSHGK